MISVQPAVNQKLKGETKRNAQSVLERIFLIVLVLFVVVLPIVIFPRLSTANPVIHSKEYVAQGFVSILLVLGCFLWPYRQRRPVDIMEYALIGYVLICLVSTVYSRHIIYCFQESWLYFALPILSIIIARIRAIKTDVILNAIIIAAIICCLYGISVFMGHNPLEKYLPFVIENQGRNYVHSFLGNPEHFGIYLAPVGVLALGLYFRLIDKRIVKYLYALIALLVIVTIVLTGARGALIGLLIGSIFVGYTSYRFSTNKIRKITNRFVTLFVALIALSIIIFSFPNVINTRGVRLAERFTELTDIRSASVKERVLFFSVAGKIIEQHPILGTGPGTFKLEFYPAIEVLHNEDQSVAVYNSLLHLKARVAEHVHNDYLEVWADTGILGFAMFILIPIIVGVWFLQMLRFKWKQDEKFAIMQIAVLFGALASIYVNALYSFPFHLPVRASMAWILIALYSTEYRKGLKLIENINEKERQEKL